DHRRQPVPVMGHEPGDAGDLIGAAGLVETAGRRLGKELWHQYLAEQMVHPGDRVAHRHGAKGIAVVAAAQGQEAVLAGLPAGLPVLHGHFHRHLDAHRAGIAEKYLFEIAGCNIHQALHQPRGRFVGEAAKHHMGKVVELIPRRGVERRVVVTVDGRPPGRHAVDQPPSIRQVNVDALGAHHRIAGDRRGCRRVGMPDMLPVDTGNVLGCHRGARVARWSAIVRECFPGKHLAKPPVGFHSFLLTGFHSMGLTLFSRAFAVVTLLLMPFGLLAGEGSDFWSKSNERNSAPIDHGAWDRLLAAYVVETPDSAIRQFRYRDMDKSAARALDAYLAQMESIDPRDYSRQEQLAYWLNVYNALSVREILPHVAGTRGDISLPATLWSEKSARIAGQKLSLNDIEHGILRPVWKDHRIHFGLNCASMDCPNMDSRAYTAATVRDQLKSAGTRFV